MIDQAKALAEIGRAAVKRTIGHDRDQLGFFLLVGALSDDTADASADLLATCEIPANIDCLTCRFQDREWAGAPCIGCLDEYTAEMPYPKWRRGSR